MDEKRTEPDIRNNTVNGTYWINGKDLPLKDPSYKMMRSEMAHEIISRKPGFLEKWALFFFLGILLTLLAGTWFVRYPDIIETRATLTAVNAPKEIIVRQEGRLVKLFVHNNGRINKNDIIGWIESTASHTAVLDLSRQVDSSIELLNSGQVATVPRLFFQPYNSLGEVQQVYRDFITALLLFNDYMVNGFYDRKKDRLENDVRSLENTGKTIRDEIALNHNSVSLSEESYKMNKKLYEEKVLSLEEFREAARTLSSKQMTGPQLEASLLSNETQKRDKLKELDQLNHDIDQQLTVFRQALQTLKSALDDWKRRFILSAPVDGKVFFTIPLQENQFLPIGKLVGYINPGDSRIYAETYLPQTNFGKIDTTLKVQLRFDAYPYQEVGFVEGTLNYISNVPSDSGFLATIRLDKGLVTYSNYSIPYKNGLKAQAIIITGNVRLLQRFYQNIIKSTSVGTK